MSLAQRIRRVLAGPDIDADGWYTRGAPERLSDIDLTQIRPVDLGDIAAEIERRRSCERLGVALPCARWRRASEHGAHVWDDEGTVAQCPGWRGEP